MDFYSGRYLILFCSFNFIVESCKYLKFIGNLTSFSTVSWFLELLLKLMDRLPFYWGKLKNTEKISEKNVHLNKNNSEWAEESTPAMKTISKFTL